MAEEARAAGVDYCGPAKTSHKVFSYVRKVDERLAGGSYLVLKSTPRFPGERPLLAIGYK